MAVIRLFGISVFLEGNVIDLGSYKLQVVEACADRVETSCADGIPIIDRLPEASNVLIACGWTGHGWAIAPAVAPLLAEWVRTGSTPELLRPFALSRFPDG